VIAVITAAKLLDPSMTEVAYAGSRSRVMRRDYVQTQAEEAGRIVRGPQAWFPAQFLIFPQGDLLFR
jgi:hypothetical protein